MITQGLLLGLGGAIGTIARFAVSQYVARQFGATFPWGTMIINISGSFLIGFIAGATDPDGRIYLGGQARQFMMIGVCGGYTTFSSFTLQTLNLVQDGEWFYATGNVLLSVCIGMMAVWIGHVCGGMVNNWR